MANRYWVGGTADWDGTAGTKWALTDGGTGGEAVPTSSDAVFFTNNDAAKGTITISAAAVCASLNCSAADANTTITGSSSLTVSGNITLSSTVVWSYSGTCTVDAAATITSATKPFAGPLTLTSGAVALGDALSTGTNALTVAGATFTVGYATTCGNLTVSSGELAGSAALSVGGNVSLGGTISYTGTMTITGACSFDSNAIALAGALTLNGTSLTPTEALSLGTNALTITSGTFNVDYGITCGNFIMGGGTLAGTSTMSVSGNVSLGGTISYTGTMTVTGACAFDSNAVVFTGNLTLNGTSLTPTEAFSIGTKTLTVTSGTLNVDYGITCGVFTMAGGTLAGSSTMSVGGSVTWNGTVSGYTGTLTITAASTLTTNAKSFGGALTINASGATVSLVGTLTITGALTNTAGTFATSTYAISCGSFSNAGTITGTTNTMTVAGSVSFAGTYSSFTKPIKITGAGNMHAPARYAAWEIAPGAGKTVTMTTSSTTGTRYSVTVTSGTLAASSYSLYCYNFTEAAAAAFSGSSFLYAYGDVTLSGTVSSKTGNVYMAGSSKTFTCTNTYPGSLYQYTSGITYLGGTTTITGTVYVYSGTLNLNGKALTCGTLIMAASRTLVGAAPASLTVNGSVTFAGTITAFTCPLYLKGTTACTFTSNGLTLNCSTIQMYKSGTSYTVTLAGSLTTSASTILELYRGTFNSSNYAISTGKFYVNNPGGTTTLGSSTVTCALGVEVAGTTISAASATFVINGTYFYGNGRTFGTFTSTAASVAVTGANTFTTFSYVKSGGVITFADNQTISGTLTVTGAEGARVDFKSNTTSARTITAHAVSLSSVKFTYITAAGDAIDWPGTDFEDGGNNLHIAFINWRYWVGSGDDWDATAGTKWSDTDGGTGGVSVPNSASHVYFTSNSGACVAVSTSPIMDLTMTGYGSTLSGSGDLTVAGNVTLGGTITCTGTLTIVNTATLTSNAITYPGNVTINASGKTVTLADALTMSTSKTLTITAGTLEADTDVTLTIYGVLAGSGNITANSDVTLGASSSYTYTGTLTAYMDNCTFTSNGKTFTGNITINTGLATFQLADDLSISSTKTLDLVSGTLDTNNHNITCGVLDLTPAGSSTADLGTSTITVNGVGDLTKLALPSDLGNLEIAAGDASTIHITDNTGAYTTTISGATVKVNRILVTEAADLALDVVDDSVFGTLQVVSSAAKAVTIAGDMEVDQLNIYGAPGALTTVKSDDALRTITQATGLIECNNCDFANTVTFAGNAIVYGGTGSTVATGGAAGWTVHKPAGASAADYRTCSTDADGSVIVTGVYNANIYYTTTGGASWTDTGIGGASACWWSSFCDADGSVMVVTTWYGTISGTVIPAKYTTDGGANWSTSSWTGNSDSQTTDGTSDGSRIISGTNSGEVRVSANSGATFTAYSSVSGSWGSACSSDGSVMYTGAKYYGKVMKSTNYGVNWSNTGSADTTWADVACSSDGSIVYACSYGGHIYKSTNGGTNWSDVLATTKNWIRISCSSDGAVVACVIDGTDYPYVSWDSGANWSAEDPAGATKTFKDVSVAKNGSKIVVCASVDYVYVYSAGSAPDYGDRWMGKLDNGGPGVLSSVL